MLWERLWGPAEPEDGNRIVQTSCSSRQQAGSAFPENPHWDRRWVKAHLVCHLPKWLTFSISCSVALHPFFAIFLHARPGPPAAAVLSGWWCVCRHQPFRLPSLPASQLEHREHDCGSSALLQPSSPSSPKLGGKIVPVDGRRWITAKRYTNMCYLFGYIVLGLQFFVNFQIWKLLLYPAIKAKVGTISCTYVWHVSSLACYMWTCRHVCVI